MGYGFGGHIGIAKETTWGSAQVSTDYIEALSESVALEIERFEVAGIRGGGLYEPRDVGGLRRAEGEIVTPGHPVAMGHWLRAVFGLVHSVTIINTSALWTHEFRPSLTDAGVNNPLPPYTLEIYRDVTSAHQYTGVQFTSIGMEIQPNQDLRCTVGVIGKFSNVVSRTTPTFTGSPRDPFTFDTASVQLYDYGSASAAVDRIEALTISFDNQLEGLGALAVTDHIAFIRRSGPQMVRVNGTMDFRNLTDYERFVNQREMALALSVTKASSFKLVVEVPKLMYTAYPAAMPGRERLTVDFEGRGNYDDDAGYAIRALLTTTRSTYE